MCALWCRSVPFSPWSVKARSPIKYLKYLRIVVGAPGFEPGTPSPPDWCANGHYTARRTSTIVWSPAARSGGRGRVITKLVCASAIGIAGPVRIDSRRGESDEQWRQRYPLTGSSSSPSCQCREAASTTRAGNGDCMEAFGPSNRSRRGSQSLGFGPNWTFGMSSGKLQLSGYFDPFLVPKKLQLVLK
jgi:hypothetical protein